MSDLPTPINRHEQYLNAIANGTTDNLPTPPITREEVFLDYIARNGGGGGGGDVTGVKGNAESTYRKGNVNITPENIGLGNVNNTSDAQKPVSTAQQTALDGKVDKVAGKGLSTNDYDNTAKGIVDGVTSALAGKVDTSSVGSANGVAELDANGKVPSSQLPSYVDDVLEYADLAHFPATGETGKIYIAEDTNKTYRWSGSDYVEISESLALGETSSTAYRGDRGKTAYDHSQTAGNPHGTSASQVMLSDGVTSVEDALVTLEQTKIINVTLADDTAGYTANAQYDFTNVKKRANIPSTATILGVFTLRIYGTSSTDLSAYSGYYSSEDKFMVLPSKTQTHARATVCIIYKETTQ